MTSDFSQHRRSRRRANANNLLQRFVRNRRTVASLPLASVSLERPRTGRSGVSTTSRFTGGQTGSPMNSVRQLATNIVMDDERQVRAMAKQIKRLIVEDRRRGLGVGG